MEALVVRQVQYLLPKRPLLSGVSFSLDAGDSLAICGRSGSGKTTVLSVILGLIRPQHGSIMVSNVDMVTASARVKARLRREHIGIVFQHGELVPELTAVENVAVNAMLAGRPSGTARELALELLKKFGVLPQTGAADLSGGERQRVAVARALVNSPALVLADEPTGSLDPQTRDEVADLLFEIPASRQCALVVVTHDMEVAARADRILYLEDGRLNSVPVPDRA